MFSIMFGYIHFFEDTANLYPSSKKCLWPLTLTRTSAIWHLAACIPTNYNFQAAQQEPYKTAYLSMKSTEKNSEEKSQDIGKKLSDN